MLDNILTLLRTRFKTKVLSLLDSKNFASHREQTSHCPQGLLFDLPHLKTELLDMYSLEVMSPETVQDPLAPLSHPVDVGYVSCCRGY